MKTEKMNARKLSLALRRRTRAINHVRGRGRKAARKICRRPAQQPRKEILRQGRRGRGMPSLRDPPGSEASCPSANAVAETDAVRQILQGSFSAVSKPNFASNSISIFHGTANFKLELFIDNHSASPLATHLCQRNMRK